MMLRTVTGDSRLERVRAKALTSLRLIASRRWSPNAGRMWQRSIDSYLAVVATPAKCAGSHVVVHSRNVGGGAASRSFTARLR
jgi:hypothetical protein